MSSTRFLLLSFIGAILGACASEPNSIVCPTTGITCPEGTICAAAQPVCLVSSCGNGLVDNGELCDDGNINEGDGCSPSCKPEACGNGVDDPGEICDDGNTVSGDGCAADCHSEEACGNTVIDVGEECDDPNTDNTDACVMCKNALCGDGYKRAGVEECDGDNQGNPNAPGDGCSSACQLEGCHNGRLDPDEECDDANVDNADACVLECKNARCGDGVIRTGIEECDGDVDTSGDGVPEDTCSDTCHLLGCGNGIKDPGEQCDDGGNVPGDGCSATCTFENCGNGVVDQGEQCDGNGAGTPGETADCNIDCTTSVCGDGKRNTLDLEECDNGPSANPTGNGDNRSCTLLCKLNVCGDGKVDQEAPGIEACDEGPGGNLNDGMGCSSTCSLEGCGNGTIDSGETCEDGNADPNDSCVNCQPARCGDAFVQTGVEQCDGTAGTKPVGHAEATCGASMGAAACRWQYCGNGFLEGSEQCDDSNNASGDGCTASCIREFCGDGVDNNGTTEACDGGGETATCDIDCTAATCGDGIVNDKFVVTGALKEQCDDGGTTSSDGCSAQCQFERCGNGILDTGEQCDGATGTMPVPGATCGTTGVTACRWIYCGNGILDAGEQCDNAGANSNTSACKANCQINTCGDGFQLTGIEGCDNGSNNDATKACTPACQPNLCGDGYAFTGTGGTEQCDDANASNADTCTTTCRTPECGDGQINGMEACDDGNTTNGDGCHGSQCTVQNGWTCTGTTFSVCSPTPGCGNGVREGSEVCDDGDTMTETAADCTGYNTTCTFCNSTCAATLTFVGPNCGDTVCNGAETNSSCPNDCAAVCGNNTRELGEACDNGNTSGDGCSSACIVESGYACNAASPSVCTATCGDGIKAGTEQCDDGDTASADGCSATCTEESGFACSEDSHGRTTCAPVCGDGSVVAGEVCDDRNSNACGTCNASCTAMVQDAAATGFIVVVGGPALVDGETFTLDDGAQTATVFEFDTNGSGVTAGRTAIVVAASDDAATVRGKVVTAVNGVAASLAITASGSAGAVVFLANDVAGAAGNKPIAETVANADFFISGMSGGVGHDCGATIGCSSPSDCLSGVCSSNMCQ